MTINNFTKLCVVSTCLIFSACGGNGDGSKNESGSISLNITDAPVDGANKVVVEFSGVTLKHDSGDDLVFTFDPPKSIDLLALQGTLSQPLLEDETIPAGSYKQIRLQVNAEFDSVMDSYIELIGGAQEELRVPSGSQSGLKLNTPFTVEEGNDSIGVGDKSVYTIDFDLRKSVVNPVGQPGYFLKPSLRLVQNTEVGSIAGNVDIALLTNNCSDADLDTGNAVYIYAEHDVAVDDIGSELEPLATAFVVLNSESGDYEYEIGFIVAGNYTLAFTCQADNDFDTDDEDDPDSDADDDIDFVSVTNIVIVAGEETEHNF